MPLNAQQTHAAEVTDREIHTAVHEYCDHDMEQQGKPLAQHVEEATGIRLAREDIETVDRVTTVARHAYGLYRIFRGFF